MDSDIYIHKAEKQNTLFVRESLAEPEEGVKWGIKLESLRSHKRQSPPFVNTTELCLRFTTVRTVSLRRFLCIGLSNKAVN